MIVREHIEFKRGKDPRSALKIGKRALYSIDPDKYLRDDLESFLENKFTENFKGLGSMQVMKNPENKDLNSPKGYVYIGVRINPNSYFSNYDFEDGIRNWVHENTDFIYDERYSEPSQNDFFNLYLNYT